MSAIYRIHVANEFVGAIVAVSKVAALAYAQGKYGASADVSRIDYKATLESLPVCTIFSTHETHTNNLTRGSIVRTIAQA